MTWRSPTTGFRRKRAAQTVPPEAPQPQRFDGNTAERPPRAVPVGATRWRPQTAWVAIAISFGITVGARSIVRSGGDPRLAVAVAMIALTLAPVGVVLLLASHHERPRAADFGLRRPPLALATGLVIAVLGATLVLSAVWAVSLGIDEDAPDVTDRLAATSGTLNAILVLVLVAVATPLAEEFLFRGFLFRALHNWRGFWPAAVSSSAVFAAFHVGWLPIVFVVPAGVFGLGACLLYRWTSSLYPALAMHAVLNSIGFAPAMGWTWHLPPVIGFSVATTIAIARLIALLLGEGRGPLPAEATGDARVGDLRPARTDRQAGRGH